MHIDIRDGRNEDLTAVGEYSGQLAETPHAFFPLIEGIENVGVESAVDICDAEVVGEEGVLEQTLFQACAIALLAVSDAPVTTTNFDR